MKLLRKKPSEVHDVTPECAKDHCHWCDIDEPLNQSMFMWCYECGHVYQTKRVLRRLFRRNIVLDPIRAYRHMPIPWFKPNDFNPSVVQVLWHAIKLRAEDITFCPLCSHSF